MFTVDNLDDLILFMSWNFGAAKADITPKIKGISMLGYGNPHNIVKGVEAPIHARVFYIQRGKDQKLIIINLEICFVTDVLRRRVLEEINTLESLDESQVLISSQHTHSAPSGFTEYALYNMPTPGFVPQVVDAYARGTVEAFKKAKEQLAECQIEFKENEFSPDVPVSFNRSLPAFEKNPEAHMGIFGKSKSSAVDKVMRALIIKNNDEIKAAINWFPVHTTSIPNTNTLVSPDNKGYASAFVEKKYSGCVSIFAQADAGDVTPNWIWDSEHKTMRGHYTDFFENSKFNGKLQANKLFEIIDQEEGLLLTGGIDSVMCYEDMSCITPDEEFMPVDAPDHAATTPACHGVAFAEGTIEGPGVPKALGFLLKILATFAKLIDILQSLKKPLNEKKKIWNYYNNQEPKSIFAEPGKKRIFGIKKLGILEPLKIVDPLVGTLARFYNQGSMREHTWTQQVLPVQLIKLGELLIVSLPAETTTIAGFRIKKQLKKLFKDTDVKEVITAPYSNAYCGYIVTPEEYELQRYEAGHCVFGKWTLPAFQTVIKKLAVELLKEKSNRDLSWSKKTPRFSEKELANRSF